MAQRRAVVDFIDAHLHTALDLRTMAAAVNLSASSFARHFKRSLGMAPYAYVMDRRLDRARHLLAETPQSVKEVAGICGFSDQAHLTRLFVRRYGTTPSAFRRAIGNASPLACRP